MRLSEDLWHERNEHGDDGEQFDEWAQRAAALEAERDALRRQLALAVQRVEATEAAYAGMMTRREVLEALVGAEAGWRINGARDAWFGGRVVGLGHTLGLIPSTDELRAAAHELALLMNAEREEADDDAKAG